MPKAASLHIGLNAVDPKQYSGWSGELTACEFDAKDMQTLARKQGFSTKTRLTKSSFNALRDRVNATMKDLRYDQVCAADGPTKVCASPVLPAPPKKQTAARRRRR